MTSRWHIITCEYPPAIGGVADHTCVLADGLQRHGCDVHVWSSCNLTSLDRGLDAFPAPRQLFVQWVPHGYGRRGMNTAFSSWVVERARRGDLVDVMVHEPFVDLAGSPVQRARALIQRRMTGSVLRAARRIFLSIPGWRTVLRVLPGLDQREMLVLPVPATIPIVRDPAGVLAMRQGLAPGASVLIGYAGDGGPYAIGAMRTAATTLLEDPDVGLAALGRGSERVRAELVDERPDIDGRMVATGTLSRADLSLAIQACDVLVLPYVDGVSGRRTTALSALAHGTPVVTTLGRLSEPFWVTDRAVTAVPAAHAETIGAEALRLVCDHDERVAQQTRGTNVYKQRFDPEIMIDSVLACASR